MISIEEYSKQLGVKIECFEGNFYVSLRDYEKLLERLQERDAGGKRMDLVKQDLISYLFHEILNLQMKMSKCEDESTYFFLLEQINDLVEYVKCLGVVSVEIGDGEIFARRNDGGTIRVCGGE